MINFEIKNLSIGYHTDSGYMPVVRNVSFGIEANQCFGLVGESGSGKSTLALGAIKYLAPNGSIEAGKSILDGTNLISQPLKNMHNFWGKNIGMVYQNPMTSLNPSMRIGKQIAETIVLHQKLSPKNAYTVAIEMLTKVSMPNPEAVAKLFPHQLSGGMLQRCVIAMALLNNPSLLILDEPTTALDVTTQATVLDLIGELKKNFGSSILYITHDLAVVSKVCDRVGVMYAGEIVEMAPCQELFKNPIHPYTQGLIECIPDIDTNVDKKELPSITGRIPIVNALPSGCIFHPRCKFAIQACRENAPSLTDDGNGHFSACLLSSVIENRKSATSMARIYAKKENPELHLQVSNLKKEFSVGGSFLTSPITVKAVDDVSFDAFKGMTLGVVGESGCGKTTLMRAIAGLSDFTSGQVLLNNTKLFPRLKDRTPKQIKNIQMVFQNPETSLNPQHKIAHAIQRPMKLFFNYSKKELKKKTIELLLAVNLPATYYDKLPSELSGGEKQRVAIARAFASEPEMILLDEPLSALDVSVQSALMNLLFELQTKRRTSYLFISHDLAATYHLSDYLAVMYLGRLVETGSVAEIFKAPFHPYTEALLSAIPSPNVENVVDEIRLSGSVPSAAGVPSGCAFHTRCPRKRGSICEKKSPPWQHNQGGNYICCHIPLKELLSIQEVQ